MVFSSPPPVPEAGLEERRPAGRRGPMLVAAGLVAACCVAAAATAVHDAGSTTASTQFRTSSKNAVPTGGQCVNEGDFATGNHCVKLALRRSTSCNYY
eukprot:SAG22_NODE_5940_length_927_cov_8.788647_2_plen_98_part_00